MIDIKFQPFAKGSTLNRGGRSGTIDPRLSRTHYFDGQLLTANDLNRDQIYLDERLLEMGQILGNGVAYGLDASLYDKHMLRVTPGMAITTSGRVLQLSGASLEVNLQDSGVISDLNNGRYRRFRRGLYVVTIQYTEVIDGVAEVFPKDLNTRRWSISAYAEGVKLNLVPLSLHLPTGDPHHMRATLARRLIWQEATVNLIPDDAVALGLLAMDHIKPLWLDQWLFYRPLRDADDVNARQQDLATHYQALFNDVRAARRYHALPESYSARQYYALLPPFGPLPKAAIDPINGTQQYFPEEYEVTIAPVRHSDLGAILSEAEALTPMDLNNDKDADVMVLVPMSDQAFALRARQLEAAPVKAGLFATPSGGRLSHLGGLSLRLFKRPPAHLLDSDTEAWQAIWDNANEEEVLYVRRAPRTAETNVSAVILARGFEIPSLSVDLPPDPASMEAELDNALEEAADANDKAADLKAETEKLKAQTEELKAALELEDDAALSEALKKIELLESKLKKSLLEIEKLKAHGGDISDLEAQLEANRIRIKQLQDELALANKKIAELQSGDTGSDADLVAKNKALTEKLKIATLRNSELEAEIKRLTALLEEARIKLATYEEEIAALEEKLNSLSDGATSSSSLIDELKTRLSVTEKALNDHQVRLTNAEEDVAKAGRAKEDAEKAAANAAVKLNQNLVELATARAANNTLQIQIKERNDAVSSLRDQLKFSEQSALELKLELAGRPALSEALSLTSLAKLRGVDAAIAAKLDTAIGNNSKARLAVVDILMRSDQSMDGELWPILADMARSNPDTLTTVRKKLSTHTAPVTRDELRTWNDLVIR